MSQRIFEDFNLDEYLVTECDGPGCNKEFRTLIEKHYWPGHEEEIKIPYHFHEDEEGWQERAFQDETGKWIREHYCPECAKKIAEKKNKEIKSSINELVKTAHWTAKEHGWWNKTIEFGTLIALCHSELSEAMEEYRNGKPVNQTFFDMVEIDGKMEEKPTGIPIELADVCIRIFDMCAFYGIDLEAAIHKKMEFNKIRPFRHGGKKC